MSDTENWVECEPHIDEKIELAVYFIKSEMPADVKRDIALCNSDLYFGPLYFDAEGEECSCFDKGAEQFNFVAALKRVRAWADDIDDIKVETWFNTETGEGQYERVDDAARAIVREIVGKELASML